LENGFNGRRRTNTIEAEKPSSRRKRGGGRGHGKWAMGESLGYDPAG